MNYIFDKHVMRSSLYKVTYNKKKKMMCVHKQFQLGKYFACFLILILSSPTFLLQLFAIPLSLFMFHGLLFLYFYFLPLLNYFKSYSFLLFFNFPLLQKKFLSPLCRIRCSLIAI